MREVVIAVLGVSFIVASTFCRVESAETGGTTTPSQVSKETKQDVKVEVSGDVRTWWRRWTEKLAEDPIEIFTLVLAASTILLWLGPVNTNAHFFSTIWGWKSHKPSTSRSRVAFLCREAT